MRISNIVFVFIVFGFATFAGSHPALSLETENVNSSISTQGVTPEEVLWWLPEDTETVAVTHNPSNQIGTDLSNAASSGIRHGEFAKLIQNTPLSLSIEGSRKFRTTRGFGLLPFEGCTIIVTKSDLPAENDWQKWLLKNANRIQNIADYKTYIFDEKLEQDRWHFLVTQVSRNIWLIATNGNYLESVLRRRIRSEFERQKTVRALPANLPEWKYINTNASVWALRHYRKDQALLDPTSPLSGRSYMANVPDKYAIGLAYFFDEKRSTAHIQYLTAPGSTPQMVNVYAGFWRGLIEGMGGVSRQSSKWRPVIRSISSGVIDMSFEFSKPNITEKAGMFGFGLFALFGHAIVV